MQSRGQGRAGDPRADERPDERPCATSWTRRLGPATRAARAFLLGTGLVVAALVLAAPVDAADAADAANTVDAADKTDAVAAADDGAAGSGAADPLGEPVETITVVGRQPTTATSTEIIAAEDFELRPLESGGQMLEAVANVLTAQHTGGGKAEQYYVRGFDADHGTDLAVYFDGVPMNLRSHAHGQGFLDLHFVTPETIDRLDAHKGPYFTRYGDFATAAAIDYVPATTFEKSLVKATYGEFDTFRSVGVLAPRTGVFAPDGPARGYVAFEAYFTDGPFENTENLERYSAFARGEVDVSPTLRLSGHLLGYYADWNASGLIPSRLVRDGTLDEFGSLDPTEGGQTTRVQGKVQADWDPVPNGHLMANAYVSYYDFELYSNFTYFLNDPVDGDGIVQRDKGRVYGGGRVEYEHSPRAPVPTRLRGGVETRYDDAHVFLGTQTQRRVTGTTSDDRIETLSMEPYVEVEADVLPWLHAQAGLRFAWFRYDGHDRAAGTTPGAKHDTRWLPKANLAARPFGEDGPLPLDVEALRKMELFVNFGLGYHSNDARAVLSSQSGETLPRAIGAEIGARTRLCEDRIELALDGWYLNLEDELLFVGDEGTTESVGETNRLGVEFAATLWPLEWWYLRGDVAYTSVRLDDGNAPLAQAPRFVTKAATGIRWEGFATELNLRHLGERYGTDGPGPTLSDYTVLDFAARYRTGPIEVGFAIENLTDTHWRSSEFYYESQPTPDPNSAAEDFHFSPGNPRNVRAWLTAYF